MDGATLVMPKDGAGIPIGGVHVAACAVVAMRRMVEARQTNRQSDRFLMISSSFFLGGNAFDGGGKHDASARTRCARLTRVSREVAPMRSKYQIDLSGASYANDE